MSLPSAGDLMMTVEQCTPWPHQYNRPGRRDPAPAQPAGEADSRPLGVRCDPRTSHGAGDTQALVTAVLPAGGEACVGGPGRPGARRGSRVEVVEQATGTADSLGICAPSVRAPRRPCRRPCCARSYCGACCSGSPCGQARAPRAETAPICRSARLRGPSRRIPAPSAMRWHRRRRWRRWRSPAAARRAATAGSIQSGAAGTDGPCCGASARSPRGQCGRAAGVPRAFGGQFRCLAPGRTRWPLTRRGREGAPGRRRSDETARARREWGHGETGSSISKVFGQHSEVEKWIGAPWRHRRVRRGRGD